MDADRRSAVLTGAFLLLGTVVGVIGLGIVLSPLNSATDSLTVYDEAVVLAIWLIAKGFSAPALASVAPAGGSGGSS